eukprot:6068209-Amphidinium_carterae.2
MRLNASHPHDPNSDDTRGEYGPWRSGQSTNQQHPYCAPTSDHPPPPAPESDCRVDKLEANVARLMQMMELMFQNSAVAPTLPDMTPTGPTQRNC